MGGGKSELHRAAYPDNLGTSVATQVRDGLEPQRRVAELSSVTSLQDPANDSQEPGTERGSSMRVLAR